MEKKRDIESLVEFLAEALGPDYEITFYNLDKKNKGTVAACASRRGVGLDVGQPMPDSIHDLIEEGLFEENPQQPGLTSVYDDGHVANTSIYYFDGTKEIEKGILCINLFENKFFEIIQELLYMSNLDTKIPITYSLESGLKTERILRINRQSKAGSYDEESMNLHDQMTLKTREIVKKHMGIYANDSSKFSPKHRKAIVEELYQEGVFNLKGMMGTVAEALFCSEVSVYRYLSEIKK